MPAAPKHVIDFHTHVFPEHVAARAMDHLCTTYDVSPVGDATPSGLLRTMSESGVDASVVAPVATRATQVRSINDWVSTLQSDHIVPFGALHPDLVDPAAEVEHILSLGLKGLKLQPNFQAVSPDDKRLYPAYEAAQGRLVILFHSGQEIKALPQIHAHPSAIARVHADFPNLTLVVAHMGGYRAWDDVRAHLLGKNVYFDASYCPEDQLDDAAFTALIKAHGPHRVLFGTDYPWAHPKPGIERLSRLSLSQDEIEAIAWRNAAALLRLDLK
jgi:predicted TIM-barrel fold metal-dependent hydrolase